MGLFSGKNGNLSQSQQEKEMAKKLKAEAKAEAERKETEKLRSMTIKEQFAYSIKKPEILGWIFFGIVALVLIILKFTVF